MEGLKRVVAAFFDFLQGIVVIMAVMVMIYLFIVSPQEINGASMEPNFHNGEFILTNKIEYKFHEPKRGEVVIFKSPRNKDVDYIKRIIGLPGDTVLLKDNKLYVNGNPVDEPYLSPGVNVFGGSYLREGAEEIVPEGSYFVAGDNRPHSSDSREFGPIPKEDFIGKAFLRYWPFSQFGWVPVQHYSFDSVGTQ
ncbi:signal peptidase I [Candidatus Gottesmanbacteria bacterium RIFCSPLOWO2_01_FULL_49_10]|uniref:Signal peptidase I n=1 Tax=Candidatus Gottesmanbacteria bacterium RIFCSPLOWO2_01_FULL_49_10 TaxID=1798396 RepID=A0A1F6AY19_9BACT|nr:MAG: signal peptidase I [Candidatus Gottesmanbacteria bacterium RIFCSPLOWO2_01_FULL_49_10]